MATTTIDTKSLTDLITEFRRITATGASAPVVSAQIQQATTERAGAMRAQ